MIYSDKLGNDMTWAILKQMSGELTRWDIIGIIETHRLNTNING